VDRHERHAVAAALEGVEVGDERHLVEVLLEGRAVVVLRRLEVLDAGWLRRELRQERFVLQAMRNFAELFETARRRLLDEGRYFRANLRGFSFGLEFIDFVEEIGCPRTRREVLEKTGEIFNSVYLRTRELLAGREGAAAEAMPLTSFMVDRRLA
jgi:hypothetical protein